MMHAASQLLNITFTISNDTFILKATSTEYMIK